MAETGVVESINPNIPVTSNLTSEGKIETTSTGGPLSFDELEEVTMAAKKAKAEKKEPKQEKSIDLTSDTDKGKAKSPQAKEAKEPVGKKTETKDDTQETDAPTPAQVRKMIKAKYQDSEIDLDEESLVPVKINGKEEMVQVKDLMSNYSGKTAWDKKFSELDQIRKSSTAEQKKIQDITNMVKGIYEEQDSELRIMKIAKLAGIDELQFRQKFYDDNIQWLEKYYTMSDDERRAEDLAYEAKVHKHRADTLERTMRDEQDMKSLKSQVDELKASHQVSDPEFVAKYDQMAHLFGNQQGQISINDAPKVIIESIIGERYAQAALQKVQEIGLDWDQKLLHDKITKAVMVARQENISIPQMLEYIDEAWGVKRAKNKIEEKKRENQEFLTGKKNVSQAKPQGADVWSFDQI